MNIKVVAFTVSENSINTPCNQYWGLFDFGCVDILRPGQQSGHFLG